MTKSITVKPNKGEMIKPAELIELKGIGPLTLQDRRIFNLLVEAAWGPNFADPGREFTVPVASLKHHSEPIERLTESVERLMSTIVVARHADGSVVRMQLLGTNTIKTTVNTGTLTYSFPPKLAELVRDSSIFAKLDHALMKEFSSKYAFALYEAIARRIRLQHVNKEYLSIENIRDLLGVEAGKLNLYKNLKVKAIDPALAEVNKLTNFNVTLTPKTQGRKVTGFVMEWRLRETIHNLNKPAQNLELLVDAPSS